MSEGNGNGSNTVEEVRLDSGFMEALGAEQDRQRHMMRTDAPSARFLAMQQPQLDACLADSVLKRIAWKLPHAATQKIWGLSLPADHEANKAEKLKQNYRNYHRELRSREKLRKAMEYARAYGGGALVLFVEDGRHYSEPVNAKAIKSISKIVVRHRFQIEPDPNSTESGYAATDMDDITHYRLVGADRNLSRILEAKKEKDFSYKIHKDRIIRIDGERLSDDWMLTVNRGWGLSVFDSVWDYYKGFKNGLNGCKELILTHSTLQQSIDGLRKMMQGSPDKGVEAIKQAARSVRLLYDLYGMILTDTKEPISWNARPVAGMDALVNVLRDAFIGASGMPHTVLFGESPGGLGRDGKETQINWSNAVREYQEERLEPALERLDELIFAAKNGPTRGKPPEDFSRNYPSVLKQSADDLRAARQSDLQSLSTGIQNQFLLADEARSVLRNPEFWEELSLDDDAWDEQQQQAQGGGAEQQQYGYGYGYGQEEAAYGQEGAVAPEEGGGGYTEEDLNAYYEQLLAQQQQGQQNMDSFEVELNLGDPSLWRGDLEDYKRSFVQKYGSLQNAYD